MKIIILKSEIPYIKKFLIKVDNFFHYHQTFFILKKCYNQSKGHITFYTRTSSANTNYCLENQYFIIEIVACPRRIISIWVNHNRNDSNALPDNIVIVNGPIMQHASSNQRFTNDEFQTNYNTCFINEQSAGPQNND